MEKVKKTVAKEKKAKEEKVEKVEIVKEDKKQKALFTSRVLFISALDKIYLVALALLFIVLTYNNFAGSITSLNYGFWARVGHQILIMIILFIVYLFMNWLYRCAAKTMLCVTENEIYGETYYPFQRHELSIPLNKVTGISTHNFFWIFRVLVIHQYGKFPTVFWTWTNQEFKDIADGLITKQKEKVENEYETRNIIQTSQYKYLIFVGAGLVGLIVFLGIIRFFGFMFSPERNMSGTYENGNKRIVLNKDGYCNIDSVVSDDVTACSWEYDSDLKRVEIEYTYKGYYYGSYNSSMSLTFDSSEKTLSTYSDTYKKLK